MYIKQAPLADPQQLFLQEMVKQIFASITEGPRAMAHTDLRGLMERVELPLLKPDQVVEPPPMPEPDPDMGSEPGANGNRMRELEGSTNGDGN